MKKVTEEAFEVLLSKVDNIKWKGVELGQETLDEKAMLYKIANAGLY